MKIPPTVAAPIIKALYWFLCSTLRYPPVKWGGCGELAKSGKPSVFVLWHDEVFLFPYLKKDLIRRNLFNGKGFRLFSIVSRSRDGEYLARLLQSLGIFPLRGSSSRGGLSSLLRGAKMMREKLWHACITVDGPRGPRHEAKDGAIYLAHRAGSPIVPMRACYAKAKIFSSWDKFILPLPFSRVQIYIGEPYKIEAEELTEEVLAVERGKMKNKLDMLGLEREA
ncbi:hypothetical protein FACS1894206_07340 [Deltaproteobacteria bacterium]|nr:hypothetical protein FACS1894206_07340 [Deltaproteobacteria bacterium]